MDAHLASQSGLLERLRILRSQLEEGFSSETSQKGKEHLVLSAGQCAAVAVIIQTLLGGEFVSAVVEGESHWFNRLPTSHGMIDVDITADQFGFSPIRIAAAGQLYAGTRVRSETEVSANTRHRSELLRQRAGLAKQTSSS